MGCRSGSWKKTDQLVNEKELERTGDIIIRRMRREDWMRVAAIYSAGIAMGNATLTERCPDEYSEWDAPHLPQPRHVAERDGMVVGWAALSRVSARDVYAGVAEVSIYVDPMCVKRGIGRMLLESVCVAAKALGFWTLQANVLAENKASLALHERCGFRTVGVRVKLGKDPYGFWRDIMLLERRI